MPCNHAKHIIMPSAHDRRSRILLYMMILQMSLFFPSPPPISIIYYERALSRVSTSIISPNIKLLQLQLGQHQLGQHTKRLR
jgi:hypothetical protein